MDGSIPQLLDVEDGAVKAPGEVGRDEVMFNIVGVEIDACYLWFGFRSGEELGHDVERP